MRRVFVSLLLLALPGSALLAEPKFVVVVHASNPVATFARTQLVEIYLGEERFWPGGLRVEPVDHGDEALREAFDHAILQRTLNQVRSTWQRLILTGRAEPPSQHDSDEEVLEFVRNHPGGVGYVSAGTALGEAVKVLSIHDVDDDFTQIVATHGNVELRLAGACGPGNLGRHAVLLNRDPQETIGVRVEIASWIDDTMQSSHVRFFSLDPLEDKVIGCTATSERGERRYSLVEVTDAAQPQSVRNRDERPARDFVTLFEAGTCGRDHDGHTLALANRHPSRPIHVKIERLSSIDGQAKNRSSDSFTLAPGDEKRLGCDVDGRVEKAFTVVEAEYR